MPEKLIFASYQVFAATPATADLDRSLAAKEVEELLRNSDNTVQTRGVYSTVGFTAEADVVFWWVSESADDIQDLVAEFRRTALGSSLIHMDSFLGLVRPAEFAKDHLPAFVKGEEPRRYFTVYPFVRTPEWYLLDPKERGAYLREHGEAGREFPDVLANTTSAFGLGDYEWILAFEADSLDRIVDLIRRLRATDARRFTKVEIPFYTGIRKDIAGIIADLP